MGLDGIEAHLRAALRVALGGDAEVLLGPPVPRPSTGLKPELWVHAARFTDRDGVGEGGARVARRPLEAPPDLGGYAEERPASMDVEITCIGPAYGLVQELGGLAAPAALAALHGMPPPVLAADGDGKAILRFADFTATLASWRTRHVETASGAWYEALLVFRLEGFLHVRLLHLSGKALALRVEYDPRGADLAGEHVLLANTASQPFSLTGHTLLDGAKRPHRYAFPPFTLGPGATVRVWTGRGTDNGENLYWGRRRSVWNNAGDTLRLLDAQGMEIARLEFAPPTGKARGA